MVLILYMTSYYIIPTDPYVKLSVSGHTLCQKKCIILTDESRHQTSVLIKLLKYECSFMSVVIRVISASEVFFLLFFLFFVVIMHSYDQSKV